jgi:hypothetical protein
VPATATATRLPQRLAERPSLTGWARERLQGRHLDEELAAGADPERDQALALHAHRLRMPRFRARIAEGLESAWRDAGRPRGLSAKVPLESWAILATGPELQSLIAELRTDDQCHARGVALARLLLIDAESPLYAPSSRDHLAAALSRAYRALRFGEPD